MFMPVIFPDHITHSTIKIDEDHTEVYSAGFLSINPFGTSTVLAEPSESLKIGPSPLDEDILNRALMNLGTAYFLYFNL